MSRVTTTPSSACVTPRRASRSPVSRYDRKDAYHQRAKREGYRSRAAYKLLEFHRAHQVIRRSKRVVDLGCWPGGWLQVASKLVGPKGLVVGVDKAEIDPPLELPNCETLVGDLEDPALCEQVLKVLGGRKADMLLSDAAPKMTGVRQVDRANEERLLEAIEMQIPLLLREGGDLLVKILEGPEAQIVDRRIRMRFKTAKTIKAKATRKGSTERFLFARGYRGESGEGEVDSEPPLDESDEELAEESS